MRQMTIFDYLQSPISITKPIRLIELFAGYGSQAMALKRLGADFEHYRVCEFDKYAIASYNAVHKTSFSASDIRNWKGEDLGVCDKEKYCYLLTYSFPCTDLSVAGKMQGMKKGSGTRSGLLWEVERLLNECDELPDILFMENVKAVLGKQNKEDFNMWLKFLEDKGYTNHYKVLDAQDFGIPQHRERCFMFSFLGNYTYNFPEPKELTRSAEELLEDNVEDKFYIRGERSQNLINDLIEKGDIPKTPTKKFLERVKNEEC